MAAISEVIRQGECFYFQPINFDTYVIPTPVSIKEERFVLEVIVLDSGTIKRFYRHEVNLLIDIVATTLQDPYREGKQSQPARPVSSILVVRYLENNNRLDERILNLQI